MRSNASIFVCGALLFAVACGDDEVVPERGPDAGMPRAGCASEPPLDGVDLAGVWHLDIAFDFGSFGVAMRYDVDGDGYRALFAGSPADSVTVSATDVIVRQSWMDGEDVRTRTLDACRVDGEVLHGTYESCRNDDCTPATFEAHPVRPLDEPAAEGVELVGALDWDDEQAAANVRVRDGLAYVVRFGDGMRIADVSDPTAPVEVGHAPTAVDGEIYNDVKLVAAGGSTFALVASNKRGMVAFDVSDSSTPVAVSQFPPPLGAGDDPNVHTLFVEGTRAYLANLAIAGLTILDVSDPTAPALLGSYTLPPAELEGGFVHDLFVRDGRVYLGYWNHGMVVLDTLDDPAAPTFVGAFDQYPRRTSHSAWVTEAGGRTVAIHGDEDFGAHVRIVDVEDASADFMTQIGRYQTRPAVSVHNVMAVGETALVTYYQDGLRVLDLSDPTEPREVGHFRTWTGVAESNGTSMFQGAIGVDYDNATDLVYLVDTAEDLLILRLQ